MKAVIDTNVVVSGSFWRGVPREILNALADRKFDLVLSPEIFEEYREALSRLMTSANSQLVEDQLNMFGARAQWVSSASLPKPVCTDRDDDKFIATALAGGAQFIITGDKALLKVKTYGTIKIVAARAFLSLLS